MPASRFTSAPALPLLNREFALPADGLYEIVRPGEYPARPLLPDGTLGEPVVQVVDDIAIAEMANRFASLAARGLHPELLVDFDHFSHDTSKESRAAGWVQSLVNRSADLAGAIRWSASGKAAVEGGDYRFLSPVFDLNKAQHLGGNRYRVVEIERLALTNDPNMKGGRPLSNRDPKQESAGVTPSVSDPTRQSDSTAAQMSQLALNSKPKNTMDRTKLIGLLGLHESATDDQIAAAITKNRSDAAAAADLRTRANALLEAQVERDLEDFKDVIEDREATKTLLLANRDGAIKVLSGAKARLAAAKPAPGTTPAKPVHNRAETKTPAGSAVDSAATAPVLTRAQESERDALVAFNRKEHGLDFSAAWNKARDIRPDLFPAEQSASH